MHTLVNIEILGIVKKNKKKEKLNFWAITQKPLQQQALLQVPQGEQEQV